MLTASGAHSRARWRRWRFVALSPLAGRLAPKEILIDPAAIERRYYADYPDADNPAQRVSFGTSGHRGSPLTVSFNEAHILAITQAICDHRAARGIRGPLYLGRDTHAVSAPAQRTALEVLAANGVQVLVQCNDGVTPTPVISYAILTHNRERAPSEADGIVVTPSHNPPADGGFKYNPPHGGPAESNVTSWIQERANALLQRDNDGVRRAAGKPTMVREEDFARAYVDDLRNVVDLEAIRVAGLKLGVDPLGGASVHYWDLINDLYKVDVTVVNTKVDPTFSFMTVDHDGKIRMDCSSPYAMARLVGLKDQYQLAMGNDTDADRHGIVTPGAGLMNPNHYLAVAMDYLLKHRPEWRRTAAIGKTLVSSGIIDRVVAAHGRTLWEVPVGFKWFVPRFIDGSVCFGGEESAGASFLRRDGTVWTTDKDGLIMDLLAAEILARTGRDPGERYGGLTEKFGTPLYTRIDAAATPQQKARLATLSADAVSAATLAGEPITRKLTSAPGNGAPFGGLKIIAGSGWFAARPSGTEDIYKIYAESFRDQQHLDVLVAEARQVVDNTLEAR
jgi:phosphoglucomutase